MKQFFFALLLAFSTHCAFAAPETQPLLRGSYQKIVAAHAGKPFIVALWSLTCTHCAADMEIFGKLARKYPAFNLVLISTDAPEQEEVIVSTLQRYQLAQTGHDSIGNIESWVFADSYTERLRYEIDAQWYGELPRTYFYDAQGHAVALSGVLDHAQVERWVHESKKPR